MFSFVSGFAQTNENTSIILEKENPIIPELKVLVAQGSQLQQDSQDITEFPSQQIRKIELDAISDILFKDKQSTEQLLHRAIESGQIAAIKKLLSIYQTFTQQDRLLVLFAQAKLAKSERNYAKSIRYFREMLAINPNLTPVRIELGIVLFLAQQNRSAKEQLNKALSANDVPEDIQKLIEQYLNALAKRDRWHIRLNARYLNEGNVNNVSSSPNIENTAFVKGHSMLPQKAHGIGYYLGLERDVNLLNAHYLHFENTLYGKNYWDNHNYDDITNRTYLGYTNKNAKRNWSILPFYERQWYGNHRYKWAGGVRGEYSNWLNNKWQISTALEYSKNRYHQNANLNGNNKLVSLTLVWQRTPRQFFYTGADFIRESTTQRSYSYDLKTARLGWGQEWGWGISSRITASFSKRHYKDNLRLGSAFLFSKVREDKIYNIGVTLWKRDWHLWGITPKLNYNWKKQASNFDTLYSHSNNHFTLMFDKSF